LPLSREVPFILLRAFLTQFFAAPRGALNITFRLASCLGSGGGEAVTGGFANLANPRILVGAKRSLRVQLQIDGLPPGDPRGSCARNAGPAET
jgi:hypothetical protein